jgi:hypothetical protein
LNQLGDQKGNYKIARPTGAHVRKSKAMGGHGEPIALIGPRVSVALWVASNWIWDKLQITIHRVGLRAGMRRVSALAIDRR